MFDTERSADTPEQGPGGAARAVQLGALRERMAAIGGKVGAVERAPVERRPVVVVPEAFAAVFPDGGLAHGTIATFAGSGTVLAGLLAAATGAGSWAALVGGHRRGLLAVHEMGGRLDRLAVIRDPGPDPLAVVAALADGIDLIVLDTRTDVAPARSRTIAGRVRAEKAVLLVAGQDWPHPDLQIRARLAATHGLGAGRGRLRSIDTEIATLDRAGRERTTTVRLDGTWGTGTTWTPAPGTATESTAAVQRRRSG